MPKGRPRTSKPERAKRVDAKIQTWMKDAQRMPNRIKPISGEMIEEMIDRLDGWQEREFKRLPKLPKLPPKSSPRKGS